MIFVTTAPTSGTTGISTGATWPTTAGISIAIAVTFASIVVTSTGIGIVTKHSHCF
jgi:hypothetical protein